MKVGNVLDVKKQIVKLSRITIGGWLMELV